MATDKSDVATRARRRIAIRLLPFVLLMYLVCLIDRNNVAFANLRMSVDLGFADRVYGLGVGMFFIGYIVFEVPGAIIVERWSARKWLARILISWGLITILNGFIHSAGQFYMVRLLVGISEASFSPGLIVYLTHWFRESDRAKSHWIFPHGGTGCLFGWWNHRCMAAPRALAGVRRLAVALHPGGNPCDPVRGCRPVLSNRLATRSALASGR